MNGGSGNDRIDGGAGHDTAVFTGNFEDYNFAQLDDGSILVSGVDGNDILNNVESLRFEDGRQSANSLFDSAPTVADTDGGAATDTLLGGTGSDTLIGSEGIDVIRGLQGSDRLVGGADSDRLSGGGGSDRLEGGLDNDFLRGDAGNDRLFGGAGDDILIGGANNDAISGGSGNDLAQFSGDRGEYSIAMTDDGRLQITGPDGVDLLTSVERVSFNGEVFNASDLV